MAGLQLSGLGSLTLDQWPRLALAVGSLLVALAGVGYMIWRTAALLTDEWITLAQLNVAEFENRINIGNGRAQERRKIISTVYSELTDYRDELYGDLAESPEELYGKLKQANAAARTMPNSGPAAQTLRNAAYNVIQYANYRRTRMEFDRLRRSLAYASVAVVIGTVLFALSLPPESEEPKTATASPQISDDVWLFIQGNGS